MQQARKNPRKSWELIKEAINSSKNDTKIDKITTENGVITDQVEMAHQFNTFFTGAGEQVARNIKHTQRTVEQYLPPPIQQELHFGIIGQADVVNIMREMQPKASTDSTGLSMKILQRVAMEVSVPLTHIFNISLSQGTFPEALKTSRIVPIHKGGRADLCDNYRPIALLSSISKTLEKIVSIKLTDHLTHHKIIYTGQFGFQKGKNTEHSLINAINYISNSINDGDYCIGVFLDLKKAFDVCSHDVLIKKLDNIGVRGVTLKWFKSYLENRKQVVDIGGHTSEPMLLLGLSIIQGSTLGPILFNIYINDLPRATTLHNSLFADDTAALNRGKALPELIDNTNREIAKMGEWFRANKMAINASKTKYIIFCTKGKPINTQGKQIQYNDNDIGQHQDPDNIITLERIHSTHPDKDSRAYKLLGIHLDEHLTLDTNTSKLVAKLAKALHIISKVKNILPQKALTSLYHSLIHSHLSYCPTIASITSQSNINKIIKMQKKALRVITQSEYNAHTTPLFNRLKILQYPDIIKLAQLNIMHAVHNKYAPEALLDTWTLNANRQQHYTLRNENDYALPRVKYEIIKRTPLYTLPLAWNEAPIDKYHANPTTFKIALRNSLMAQYLPPLPEISPETLALINQLGIAPAPAPAPPTAPALAIAPERAPAHAQ